MQEISSNTFTPPHPLKTAVLFLIFNRPDTTKQVFAAIRKAKPPKLYVAADGPRADNPGEAEKVEQVRLIATNIDWDCELKTLFRDENLGCGKGVSSAITWFFENEGEGIILEDDCLPSQSFFWYCEELLERYREDKI
jgi:GT2 family glycosyltransferase